MQTFHWEKVLLLLFPEEYLSTLQEPRRSTITTVQPEAYSF